MCPFLSLLFGILTDCWISSDDIRDPVKIEVGHIESVDGQKKVSNVKGAATIGKTCLDTQKGNQERKFVVDVKLTKWCKSLGRVTSMF